MSGWATRSAGGPLVPALVNRAREDGLARLHAVVLLTNTPMLRLLQHYGWALAAPTEDFSVAFLEISTVGRSSSVLRAATWAAMFVMRHGPDAGTYLAHSRPITWSRERGQRATCVSSCSRPL